MAVTTVACQATVGVGVGVVYPGPWGYGPGWVGPVYPGYPIFP